MSEKHLNTENRLPDGGARFTALVVEDDAIYRSVYKRRLKAVAPRARVIEATDGFRALLSVAEQVPDLVILDFHTPSFSGVEFLQILKRHDEYASLPVIVITSSSIQSARRFQSFPNVHVFQKPIRIALFDRILSLIVRKMRLDGACNLDKLQENMDIHLGNDPAVQREVARIFYENAPERLAELEFCVCTSNIRRLREWCHAMKGSVSLFGASDLLSLIVDLRSACLEEDLETIDQNAAGLTLALRSFVVDLGARFGLSEDCGSYLRSESRSS